MIAGEVENVILVENVSGKHYVILINNKKIFVMLMKIRISLVQVDVKIMTNVEEIENVKIINVLDFPIVLMKIKNVLLMKNIINMDRADV